VILSLLLLATAQGAMPAGARSDEILYRECIAVVRAEPERAINVANDWRMRGGGVLARQCMGLAYTALERWAPAAVAFEQAAREAETEQDPRRSDFWVQSGNSWLAGGEAGKALTAFDAALATTSLTAELRGEVHIDRARAGVALGDVAGARRDLDRALELVPADPFGWMLSAALAMRENALPRAQRDIAKALEMAPEDPDVLLQAGTIAAKAGETANATQYYEKAATVAPQSDAGKAAWAALEAGSSEAAQATPTP
jgi:tetratricopeptide (TPR) repeat protein